MKEKLGKKKKKGPKLGKEGKLERKSKNQEGSFTLPLLTVRTGYATDPSRRIQHKSGL